MSSFADPYDFDDDEGPLMTEKEFARAVGLAPVTIRMKRSRGELAHYKLGRAVRYSREQLEQFLAQGERKPTKKQQGQRRP
jgi:excisionase family DNA binding protein